MRHEAHAAYEAKRYALLQKQHEQLLARSHATGEAEERVAASSAALAEKQGLERLLRAETRGAAIELEQLRVRSGGGALGRGTAAGGALGRNCLLP